VALAFPSQLSTLLQLPENGGESGMAVHVDHTRPTVTGERKLQKAFGSNAISFRRQPEVNRAIGRVHSPIQISPLFCHTNARFIDPPRPVRLPHLLLNPVLQNRRIFKIQRAMVE
jgi:hypothetical protein